MKYTLAQIVLAVVLLWLPFAFVRGLKLGSLSRGVRSATIRFGFLLVVAYLAVANWEGASSATRSKIVGWAVLAGLAALTARGSGRGGIIGLRGRNAVDRAVGRGRGGPVVPRHGGGRVVGPRPFNAGGVTYVPVAVDRGRRAVVGVGRRVGRGTRHLEAVGGRAVRNVREGRLPWRTQIPMAWIRSGAWLEMRLRQQRKRTVDELRADADGLEDGDGFPDYVPSWAERGGWSTETDRLRRDVDRRRRP